MSAYPSFRAVLADPGNTSAERPLQTFHPTSEAAEHWASVMLPRAVSEDAAVLIYQSEETQVKFVIGKGKPA